MHFYCIHILFFLAPLNNGKIVINEEERLNMLHKKARLLRQQYSALGPQNQMSQGGMNIKRQIDDVNRQTLQLEPLVKMKNPFGGVLVLTKDPSYPKFSQF